MDNFFETEAKWMLVLMLGLPVAALVMGVLMVLYLNVFGSTESPDCGSTMETTTSTKSPTELYENGTGK